MDNSVVKMVSTVHSECKREDVEANGRQPRANIVDKNNLAHSCVGKMENSIEERSLFQSL